MLINYHDLEFPSTFAHFDRKEMANTLPTKILSTVKKIGIFVTFHLYRIAEST